MGAAKMAQFQSEVAAAVEETKYNNADYVAIVEKWFHDNEKDVSPGQIHSNKNNYSNQCIWRRRKLPYTKYSHIMQRIGKRKQFSRDTKKTKTPKRKITNVNNQYLNHQSMKIPLIQSPIDTKDSNPS